MQASKGWPLEIKVKVGFGIYGTNADSQWNLVYNAFHRFLWKRNYSSFVNVILTRQTYGQRSSRAAKSKRPALGNYFSEQICYMFLISKCRGDWDSDLCTFWILAKKESLRNATFRFFCRQNTFFSGSRYCAEVALFFARALPHLPQLLPCACARACVCCCCCSRFHLHHHSHYYYYCHCHFPLPLLAMLMHGLRCAKWNMANQNTRDILATWNFLKNMYLFMIY